MTASHCTTKETYITYFINMVAKYVFELVLGLLFTNGQKIVTRFLQIRVPGMHVKVGA